MQLRACLYCFSLVVFSISACRPAHPVADPDQLTRWYEEDAIERIVLAETGKTAEIHLRTTPGTKPRQNRTYYLPYDDFGTFLNDYLAGLNEKYPGRNVIITIK